MEGIHNAKKDILDIANEITVHSYRMGKTNMDKLFININPLDYEIITILSKHSPNETEEKFYLADIAEKVKLPVSKVSKVVRLLADRNLVIWQHDGNGEDGTYIQITKQGNEAVKAQQEILRNFYTNVIDSFGREKFLTHLQETIELDNLMQKELGTYEEV